MRRTITSFLLSLSLVLGAAAVRAGDLSVVSSEELLRVYAQLRQLGVSDQSALTENVVFKRDAATFTFVNGHLTFAAPVGGRVLGAVFEGQGTVLINPPTPMDQRQIARFTKGSVLQDQFRQAVFFFTDDSWSELQKLVRIQGGAASVGGALSQAQRKYAESFNDWWGNEAEGNFQMRNLPARMLADLTDPTSRGLFLADFKGDRLGDLLYHVSWNRDPILLPDFAKGEEVMLLHYNRGNYFEWWSGFHLAEEYARTPRPDHRTLLAHCREARIDAEVAKDNRLAATADLEFEVPSGSARVLPLNLRGVLRISDVQDAEGKKVAFIQEDRKLDNDPWFILPEPAKAGQTYKMRITYAEDSTRESRIVHQRGSGLYYVTARESWFPSFGAFDDRSLYSLHMRSPKKFGFVGTGRLVKSEKGKDSLETEWESEIPFSVVGFNYGDFAEKSQSDPNITVTAYSGKEPPDELKAISATLSQADIGRGERGGLSSAAQLGIMEGGFNTTGMLRYAAGLSFQALKFFEYWFGTLPFKTVSVTEQPVRGYGQSWPTLIFLPYDSLLDETTRNSLRLQESAEQREFYNLVAVHEMAHQWWGHLVGWKTYHDQWLSEGIAEFAAALFLKQFEPKKWNGFWDLKRRWLLNKNRVGDRPVDVGPLWLNFQLNEQLEHRNSMYLIYYKGAYVMEMLRAIMEDPRAKNPDARFIAMMHDFTSTYAGKNVSTEDFRRVVEKHMGEPMDWFFNEWVYGAETPTYDLKYQLKPGDGGKTVLSISLKQSGVSDSFQMRVPFYAYVKGQPLRLGLIKIQGSNTISGELPLPFQPEKVTLDVYRSILCTLH